MTVATDIERKNLEAHVELCAERYKNLDDKLDTVEKRVSDVEKKLDINKNTLSEANDKHNRQLITIGTSLIVVLIGAMITLIVNLK